MKPKWTEWRRNRRQNSSTQVEGGRREEKHKKHQLWISVSRMHCVSSSIYRENSQLKSEKLWEQVIHIFDLAQKYLNCVPKYIILSIKIYCSVNKYVIQYINILLSVKIYFRSSTKIH